MRTFSVSKSSASTTEYTDRGGPRQISAPQTQSASHRLSGSVSADGKVGAYKDMIYCSYENHNPNNKKTGDSHP